MFSFLFDPINISLIITGLLNLFLGVLVFISGRNKKINIVFSLNIVAVISWILAMLFYRSASENGSLFWCTVLYVTPTFIASSFLYFTYIFPSQKEKYVWLRAILIFSINLAIVAMVFWPGFILKEINARPGQEKEIVFTSYYWLYFLYTLSFFSFGFVRLFKKYFKIIGIERSQIIYLLSGYALAANFAFVTNLVMPWIGFFFLNWLGQIFTLIGVASTTYAILKYRLMDIRIVVRKFVIYFLSAGFVYGMFYLVTWAYNKSFGGVYNKRAYVLGLIVAPLFVLFFVWLNNKIKGIANKYLFFSLYNYQETINKLSQRLNYLNDLDEIVDLIVDTVKQSMQLDRVAILLTEFKDLKVDYKIVKTIGFEQNNGFYFTQDGFLANYLQEKQKIAVREELQIPEKESSDEKYRKNIIDTVAEMKESDISLYLPLMSNKKLIGVIVLGSKVSKDAYTKEDLDLLNTLAYQAGIAIDNARLYKQVQDFNKTLQQKVDEQTKDIKEAYEVEKQAHEELKKLDKSKSQFMAATQHHLRTPLTVMNGYVDLLLEGQFGKLSEKVKDIEKRFQGQIKKLIDIVNEFLDISQFQLGRSGLVIVPDIKIKPILEEIIDELKPEADAKKIFLEIKKPDKDYVITADLTKLRIALFNVVDNAVKFTIRGGVTITIDSKTQASNYKPAILITVKDTGIGISKEDIDNLFEKTFERSEEAEKTFVLGRGIGLYLAGHIIEEHNGRIWAESDGEGKGSVFFIELPLDNC